ncbi:MAG: NAD(P)H-dependent oxidoreductase [Vannielia sp.]|uniref:NADPH-dependent FMN reductase n=1 Tax=Vannielia sp. TaxID=2813045 RepID=UPI003B8CF43D
MRTLLFLSGSSLRTSLNSRLSLAAARFAETRFDGQINVLTADLMEYDLPPIEPSAADDPSVAALTKLFDGADGFFVSADEYTGAFSTQFRLALNWLMLAKADPRPVLSGKPTALVGAAPMGVGGMRGLPALKHLLQVAGMDVHMQQLRPDTSGGPVDGNGNLTASAENLMLEGALGRVVELLQATSQDQG